MIEVIFTLLYPYLWAGTAEDGYYKVWLNEINEGESFGGQHPSLAYSVDKYGKSVLGRYYTTFDWARGETVHVIEILEGHAFQPDYLRCNTIWDHEWYHAMGYEHGEWPLVTC